MFYLNQVSLDYLTLTSFNPLFYLFARDYLEQHHDKKDGERHRMQYTGALYHSARGTAFLGTGSQKGEDHHLLQISGLLADDLWTPMSKFLRGGTARATRIDVQMTVEYQREHWDAHLWAERLREWHPNMSVSSIESQSGPAGSKLATIYFGSRQSNRFVRLYEKMGLGEDVYLRFEVEYKGERARAVAAHMLAEGEVKSVFQSEVERTKAKPIISLFDTTVKGRDIEVIKPEPATLKWLREQVAPALFRVLNDDNIDSGDVRDYLLTILTDSLD